MKRSVRIGIIGDYDANRPSHRATDGALAHCAEHLKLVMEMQWLPTGSLESGAEDNLKEFDGFFCAPGGPYKSMEGALNAIRYAREHDVPFIGTCGGFQNTVIEYARNVFGIYEAQHEAYDPGASVLLVTTLACSLAGENRKVFIEEGSLAYRCYGLTETIERFNCNFGLNPEWRQRFDESEFRVSGLDENGEARILELASNRFHVATLFQPQLSSTQDYPHRLILAYLNSANEFHMQRGKF